MYQTMPTGIVVKIALQKWAKSESVTPADLALKTGLTYQHAWNILRGKFPVNDETIGILFRAYGTEGPMVYIANALSKQRHNGDSRS